MTDLGGGGVYRPSLRELQGPVLKESSGRTTDPLPMRVIRAKAKKVSINAINS